jgi:hypothetical protein
VEFAEACDASAIDLHFARDEVIEHEILCRERRARFSLAKEEEISFRPSKVPRRKPALPCGVGASRAAW